GRTGRRVADPATPSRSIARLGKPIDVSGAVPRLGSAEAAAAGNAGGCSSDRAGATSVCDLHLWLNRAAQGRSGPPSRVDECAACLAAALPPPERLARSASAAGELLLRCLFR